VQRENGAPTWGQAVGAELASTRGKTVGAELASARVGGNGATPARTEARGQAVGAELASARVGGGSGSKLTLALAVLLALLAAAQLACRAGEAQPTGPRVIILGFDGLDWELTNRLMAEGRLPNFSRLAEEGQFRPLGTSKPPQSPVAWSDFITGLDSGGHGIFDFVHRDPETLIPFLSTSRAHDPERVWTIGQWQIPLSSGEVELLRRGTPFWEVLEGHGVPTTVLRMPANYPVSGTATRELSGMGTPDILGSYGTFSFYTSELFFDPDVAGGEIFEAWPENGVVEASLRGPDNPFYAGRRKLSLDFRVHLDPEEPVAKLVVGDEQRVLQLGEWSDWVPLRFRMAPTQYLPAMARFYLRSLEPEFELYVTPLNFDPLSPAGPISHPPRFAAELARATGRFYTQGMPEDTHALKGRILDREEFLAQAKITRDEMIEQYHHVLAGFREGLLFYYMGTADQISHMLWDTLDPEHPAYVEETHAPLADVIPSVYEELDAMVGHTLEHAPPGTLVVVMSDHGFASWRRIFHLNTWLREEGYLAVRDPHLRHDPGLFANVDWSRTRAYGLGINGLYINLAGRERQGIVPEEERRALMREIADKLLAVVDPATGEPAITKMYLREEDFEDGGYLEIGPDLVVGYAKGTRNSSESSLGGLTREVFEDNLDDWPGDHLMDHEAVPGVLLTSRPLARQADSLRDLAGAILAEFGVDEFP
jgi:predicted AlkP superfamily phosphohydrolase/phosphomutase